MMSRKPAFHLILVTALLSSLTIAAQTAGGPSPAKPALHKANQIEDPAELGLSLLTQAIAQCGNCDPASRAAVYYLAGHALAQARPKLADDSLAMAYRTLDQLRGDKTPGLDMLEGNIVRETALAMPSKVEEALPEDESMRATALSALVEAYAKSRKIDHAIELVALIRDPEVYPAVHTLLDAIPATDMERRSRVFGYAIEQYGKTQHTANIVGFPDDLGSLTVRCWKTLPARQVLNAIDILLDEADPDQHQSEVASGHSLRVTASDSSGTRVLALYDYRLDQVIPILRSLNPQRADALSKKRVDKPNEPAAKSTHTARIAIGRDDASVSQQVVAMEQTRIAAKLVALADTNPQSAVSQAEAIGDTSVSSRTLVGIASEYITKDPPFAVSVLGRVRSKGSAVPGPTLDDAINLAMKLDRGLTEALLETKFEQAERQYKKDSDPDHPNAAIKLYWPSTSAWRDAFQLAYKLSPKFAVEKLSSVQDAEIESMERAMLACSFLKVPVWSDSPIGMR